jgi:hypothetical protein
VTENIKNPEAQLKLPFRLRGCEGEVRVECGINVDPKRWGNTLLFEPPPPLTRADIGRGFPLCHAVVSFPGEGYTAYMGWIQVVHLSEASNRVFVDQSPQLEGTGMPYVCWGLCPAFFDNPYTNADEMHFRADTFLVTTPDVAMTRVVQPVRGFSLGYSKTGKEIRAQPLKIIDDTAWQSACLILRPQYPKWEFLDALVSNTSPPSAVSL